MTMTIEMLGYHVNSLHMLRFYLEQKRDADLRSANKNIWERIIDILNVIIETNTCEEFTNSNELRSFFTELRNDANSPEAISNFNCALDIINELGR